MQAMRQLRSITRFAVGDRVLCLPMGDPPHEFRTAGREPDDFAEEFADYVQRHGVAGELRGRTDSVVYVRDDEGRTHEFLLEEVLVCKPANLCRGK